jgi:hypothetical protein
MLHSTMLNSTSNRKPSPVPTNSTNANNGNSVFSPSADSLAIAYATAAPNEGDIMFTSPTQPFAAAALDGNRLCPPSAEAVALAYARRFSAPTQQLASTDCVVAAYAAAATQQFASTDSVAVAYAATANASSSGTAVFRPISRTSISLNNLLDVASSPKEVVNLCGSAVTNEDIDTFTIVPIGVKQWSRQSSISTTGRTTPVVLDEVTAKRVKTGKEGHEKGAVSYSSAERVYLLQTMLEVPDSFCALESSPEWKEVYTIMCEEYYAKVGVPVRQSVTLQSHFVELYSGFKNGIHGISLIVGAHKCPASFVNDDTEVNNYIQNLQEYLLNSKKIPKKWWSSEVVQLLLQLHLEYVKDFGGSQQGISFIESKKQQNKSKFITDQQNRETELARKRAVEEEE